MSPLEIIPSRFEYKYLLDELQAVRVREFLLPYLQPDEHSPADPTANNVKFKTLPIDSMPTRT